MTELEKTILDRWQVRKTGQQKTEFLAFMQQQIPEARIEQIGKNRNLLVGDPDSAKLLLTAHYDTCAAMPFPNILFPRSILGNLLFTGGLVAAMIGLEFLVLLGSDLLLGDTAPGIIGGYLLLLGFLSMAYLGPANKHTVNDNTSGVCLLVRLIQTMPEALKSQLCFVFFDNEEQGLVGSGAFAKKHKAALKNTPVLNFDCVSDGHELLVVPKKKAMKALGDKLQAAFTGNAAKQITVCRALYPSDQLRFPLGVGIAAFSRAPLLGLYMGRIHTRRDTVWMEENLRLLAEQTTDFAKGYCNF